MNKIGFLQGEFCWHAWIHELLSHSLFGPRAWMGPRWAAWGGYDSKMRTGSSIKEVLDNKKRQYACHCHFPSDILMMGKNEISTTHSFPFLRDGKKLWRTLPRNSIKIFISKIEISSVTKRLLISCEKEVFSERSKVEDENGFTATFFLFWPLDRRENS